MLQNDLFAAGTGTGSKRTSRPRAVAFARNELAVVRQGSVKATRSTARGVHRIALQSRSRSPRVVCSLGAACMHATAQRSASILQREPRSGSRGAT